ncbi:SRPBCC family protein [Nocardia arthritidis]|nr:SRPBCC family protein [Nocardia arthritidis]
MKSISRTGGEIPASRDEVWAVVSDPARNTEWVPWHDRWLREPAAPVTRGRGILEQVTVFGSTHTIEWTVTDWTPPQAIRLAAVGQHGLSMVFVTRVDPVDESRCAVTFELALDGPVLEQVPIDAIESAVGAEFETALAQLEKLMS